MLLPITGEIWRGAMVLLERDGDEFNATTLGRSGFYLCVGARHAETAKRVDRLWSDLLRLINTKIRVRFEDQTVPFDLDCHELKHFMGTQALTKGWMARKRKVRPN